METLLRLAVVGCIKDSGAQLKKWIGVLDEIAAVQGVMTPEIEAALPEHARIITDTTLELALAITQAYARAFDRFIEYGVRAGLADDAPTIGAVVAYKGLISNPRGLYEAMCHQHATALDNEGRN